MADSDDSLIPIGAGEAVAMRMWRDEEPGEAKPEVTREYETIGLVIAGRAELEVEGRRVELEPGTSYRVPRGARHRYRITERFTSVEAISPPDRETKTAR